RLRTLARRVGLVSALDLKVVEYFDFCPVEGGFAVMKDRKEFPRGPVEDRLCSLFHVLQRTANEGLASVIRRRLDVEELDCREVAVQLTSDLEAGRPIEGRLSPGHTGVPFANFTSADIGRALAAPVSTCATATGG